MSLDFTRHDYEDLKGNPVWENIVIEMKDRYDACIHELLKLDNPYAIEANLIIRFIDRPKDLVNLLEEDEE